MFLNSAPSDVKIFSLFSAEMMGALCRRREMNTWVWYQIGLEFSTIDIQGTIEAQRRSETQFGNRISQSRETQLTNFLILSHT